MTSTRKSRGHCCSGQRRPALVDAGRAAACGGSWWLAGSEGRRVINSVPYSSPRQCERKLYPLWLAYAVPELERVNNRAQGPPQANRFRLWLP